MQPCPGCPWNGGRGVVRSPERRPGALVAVIGEGPADTEVDRKTCFVGPSGVELEKTLLRSGLSRAEVAIENAFACAKPKNARPGEEVRAVEVCRGRLWEFLEEVRPQSLVLMGGRALRSIAPGFVASASNDGLLRHRGSLWARDEVNAANRAIGSQVVLPKSVKFVMATIHPAAIIRRERIEHYSAMGYRLVPAVDVSRLAKAVVGGRRELAKVEVERGVPPWSGEDFVFDLETDSERRPTVVGVQKLSGGPVWSAFWGEAEDWLATQMRSGVLKVGHNIVGFDLPVLMGRGLKVASPYLDTMTMAGVCEPDMARGLYYQMAYYGGHVRPYWKELVGEDGLRQQALRAAWEQTGVVPHGMLTSGEWMTWYNALDVDSTRYVANAQMLRAKKEGWAA